MPHYNKVNVPPRRWEEGKEKQKWNICIFARHHIVIGQCVYYRPASLCLPLGTNSIVSSTRKLGTDGRTDYESQNCPSRPFRKSFLGFSSPVSFSLGGGPLKKITKLISICMDTTLRQIQCVCMSTEIHRKQLERSLDQLKSSSDGWCSSCKGSISTVIRIVLLFSSSFIQPFVCLPLFTLSFLFLIFQSLIVGMLPHIWSYFLSDAQISIVYLSKSANYPVGLTNPVNCFHSETKTAPPPFNR